MQIRITILLLLAIPLPRAAKAEITFDPTWELTSYQQARDAILAWIDQSKLSEEIAFQARSFWPQGNLRAGDGAALLDRAVETFAVADPQAKALFDACHAEFQGPLPPSIDWLVDPSQPQLLRNNLRLFYARWLAQHQYYDEVLATLENLKPTDVFDPAGLLFYRMVAHHQVVEPDKSRLTLERLLERETELPRRYLEVARLLRRDLSGLKDDSLDHVARRMNDVRRRLDIGRAGKQVQVVEKGVVDSLDKMIKKLEEQQQGGGGGNPGGQQSAKPLQQSQLPSNGAKPPMKVDQKEVGNKSGWGNLPPKEREQALQQIGRDYPAHYRELIEQYFRELADESKSEPGR